MSSQAQLFEDLSTLLQIKSTWDTSLEGRMFTLIDAMIAEKEQREAFKSLVRGIIRDSYKEAGSNILQVLNDFTDKYEGKMIEYSVFGEGSEKTDRRNGGYVPVQNLFDQISR